MRDLVRLFRRLVPDRRAATAVEYGLILAMIVLATFASLAAVGNVTSSMWNDVSEKVQSAH
ncbi:MAG: Flp family type IVb pilin [Sphingomonas sp.]|uniref:Flp family type IVb pilin n=1 Tax=Sphingomonas sp. TaxID=28214 RepID=UPI001B0390EF|nr:Flp family type IVb pilin [Sphingomonas sp.]MBO9623630.1 Flp family type IVb pilin [Sphingomonas sp.]